MAACYPCGRYNQKAISFMGMANISIRKLICCFWASLAEKYERDVDVFFGDLGITNKTLNTATEGALVVLVHQTAFPVSEKKWIR